MSEDIKRLRAELRSARAKARLLRACYRQAARAGKAHPEEEAKVIDATRGAHLAWLRLQQAEAHAAPALAAPLRSEPPQGASALAL